MSRKPMLFISAILSFAVLVSGAVLASSRTSADVVDDVTITVPEACNLSTNTGAGEHYSESMMNGQYKDDIGDTEFTVACNTDDSFAIYAIGFSGDEYGGTEMLGSSTTGNIATGTATSGDNSAWAMKLTPVSGTITPTIDNGYENFSVVPDTYTKVASIANAMSASNEAKVKATYAVYVSPTQSSGTYLGKVKYTVVHPNDARPPYDPRFVAQLDTGQTVNRKLKRLAGNSSADYNTQDNTITALVRADSLPSGFTPTANNTISTSSSTIPIYAWYDSASTTIYYYSDATDIKMNQNSTNFFYNMCALSDLSTISSWNAASVTDMYNMFNYAGRSATTFTLDLSSWDTSSVTNMSYMFYWAGYTATTWSVGDLSSWDTSSVTDMSEMFDSAGYSATTWSVGDLSSWNTANVTGMSGMFSETGRNATTWSVGDLSSWNTANVTGMYRMFHSAGYNATTWSIGDLSSWDTSSVTDMSGMFSGTGRNATTWSVGDLSSWDTSSVTDMSYMFDGAGYNSGTFTLDLSSWNTASVTTMSRMFYYAGRNATTWSVTIPRTNGAATSPIANTTSRLYGKTTSTYVAPPSGRSFTLAN